MIKVNKDYTSTDEDEFKVLDAQFVSNNGIAVFKNAQTEKKVKNVWGLIETRYSGDGSK